MLSSCLLLHSLHTYHKHYHEYTRPTKQSQGVIDVGSNSIRLCIYVYDETKDYPLKKIFDEKKTVSLSAYIHSGILSDEGIAVAAKALKHQISHAKQMKCSKLGIFATAAIRNCVNSRDVIAYLSNYLQHPIEVATGLQEARLGLCAIQPEFSSLDGFLVDIGGGSSEVSFLRNNTIIESVSFPVGALSLWNSCVEQAIPTWDELDSCRRYLQDLFSRSDLKPQDLLRSNTPLSLPSAIGVGGTLRTIGKLLKRKEAHAEHQNTAASPDSAPENPDTHTVLTKEMLQSFIQTSITSPGNYTRDVVLVAPARIHTLIPGAVIAHEILEWTGAEELVLAEHGAREGYVLMSIQKEQEVTANNLISPITYRKSRILC